MSTEDKFVLSKIDNLLVEKANSFESHLFMLDLISRGMISKSYENKKKNTKRQIRDLRKSGRHRVFKWSRTLIYMSSNCDIPTLEYMTEASIIW